MKNSGWVQHSRRACGSTPKGVLTGEAKTHSRNGRVLETTLLSIICIKWVCASAFDDHAWVSEGIGLRNPYSVCGTMVHAAVLHAPTVESNTVKGFKNQKISRRRGHGDSRHLVSMRTHRERACWHRWSQSCTKHTESGE